MRKFFSDFLFHSIRNLLVKEYIRPKIGIFHHIHAIGNQQ